MELIALTMSLSPSNFIGIGKGTKVTVISKEQFYEELNNPLFRGVYVKPTEVITDNETFVLDVTELEKANFMYTIGKGINVDILNKIVFVPRVFNWTKDYKALYYIEYADVPNSINPPAYMRIEPIPDLIEE